MTGLVGVPAGISTLSSAPGAPAGVQLAESCQLLENEPFQVFNTWPDRKVDVLVNASMQRMTSLMLGIFSWL